MENYQLWGKNRKETILIVHVLELLFHRIQVPANKAATVTIVLNLYQHFPTLKE